MSSEVPIDPLLALRPQSDLFGWGGQFEYATSFEHPKLNDVLASWLERARGGIPSRADFGMRTLKDVLPPFWMFEKVGRGEMARYRCRRMGTEIAAAFGDMTGKYLDEAIPGELVPRWTTAS